MQYRTFRKTGEKISLLGTGTMRLPLNPDGTVNQQESISIIRNSIDRGVNYVDTAYMYHGGESEKVLGEALKNGYREKVFLADKMPVWMAQDRGAMEKIFAAQFERLGVDVIDMYLIHNANQSYWERAKQFNLLDFLEKMRAVGKIKYIGFSFHDTLPMFKEVIDAYPWDFCQIQLNYMDQEFQAGVEGLKYAASKNIPVIVMEPLKGGKLTDTLPPQVTALWAQSGIQRSPAEWALRWVAGFPEVLTILSGMSSMAQLDENVDILSAAEANSLTDQDLTVINQVAETYNRLLQYACTSCKYCMDSCPQKIDIPTAVNYYNDWLVYEKNPKIKGTYQTWVEEAHRASNCIDCKACEEHCPQHLPISEIMKLTAAAFE